VRKTYDFSEAKRNPYARRLKRQVTIRLDENTIQYFTKLASEMGIPYQTLINLYLRDCAGSERKLSLNWQTVRESGSRYMVKKKPTRGPEARRPRPH
jgi:antitoxin component of RelBE/YafQ-DinJ toxin-antitoxin module